MFNGIPLDVLCCIIIPPSTNMFSSLTQCLQTLQNYNKYNFRIQDSPKPSLSPSHSKMILLSRKCRHSGIELNLICI